MGKPCRNLDSQAKLNESQILAITITVDVPVAEHAPTPNGEDSKRISMVFAKYARSPISLTLGSDSDARHSNVKQDPCSGTLNFAGDTVLLRGRQIIVARVAQLTAPAGAQVRIFSPPVSSSFLTKLVVVDDVFVPEGNKTKHTSSSRRTSHNIQPACESLVLWSRLNSK